MKTHGVLIIGLDGATFDLLDPWLQEGKLPYLSELKKKGCHGKLRTVPNLHSAAAWTSIVTGQNPGKHGLFSFYERDHDFNFKFCTGKDRKVDALWTILSREGKKVGIINVPMTFPAETVNGVMISGLDAPSIKDKRSIYPVSLKDNYQILQNDYDIVPSITVLQKADIKKAVDKWIDIASARASLCQMLLRDYDFDFFMVTFTITDWAHHHLWKYFDLSYPSYNQEIALQYSHLIFNIYQKVDDIVGMLMNTAGPQTNVIILSDHGAGPHQQASYYLVDWMREKKYLHLKQKKFFRKCKDVLITKSVAFLKNVLPGKLKSKLKGYFPGIRNIAKEDIRINIFNLIDWSKTKAYTEHKWHNIWINLQGREKHGIVKPGKEYDDLLDEIKQHLLEWKDAKTGKHVVDKVFKKSEIYWGDYADRAPDLQIWWENDVVLHENKEFFSKTKIKIRKDWSGDHRLDGVFIAKGPSFKEGISLNNLSVYDITPTILHLLGHSIPQEIDGKIIKRALREDLLT